MCSIAALLLPLHSQVPIISLPPASHAQPVSCPYPRAILSCAVFSSVCLGARTHSLPEFLAANAVNSFEAAGCPPACFSVSLHPGFFLCPLPCIPPVSFPPFALSFFSRPPCFALFMHAAAPSGLFDAVAPSGATSTGRRVTDALFRKQFSSPTHCNLHPSSRHITLVCVSRITLQLLALHASPCNCFSRFILQTHAMQLTTSPIQECASPMLPLTSQLSCFDPPLLSDWASTPTARSLAPARPWLAVPGLACRHACADPLLLHSLSACRLLFLSAHHLLSH